MSYMEKYMKYKTKYLQIKQILQNSEHGAEILAQIDTNVETENSLSVKQNDLLGGNLSLLNENKSESDSLSDLGRLTDSDSIDILEGGAKLEDNSSSSSSSNLSDSDKSSSSESV